MPPLTPFFYFCKINERTHLILVNPLIFFNKLSLHVFQYSIVSDTDPFFLSSSKFFSDIYLNFSVIFLSFFTVAFLMYFLHFNSFYNLLSYFYMWCFRFRIFFSLTQFTFCTSHLSILTFIHSECISWYVTFLTLGYTLICHRIFSISPCWPLYNSITLSHWIAPTSYHTPAKNVSSWNVAFFIIQYLDPSQDHLYG